MKINAEILLAILFEEILPEHGLLLRPRQEELSMEMLRALQNDKIALCEAEVGTGKTHAYLLALVIHNLYSAGKIPALISTSTIALQKALTEEYIPQLSAVLMKHHIIKQPLSFVVHKGKSHYVCDLRLKIYEDSLKSLGRETDTQLLAVLEELWGEEKGRIDLDRVALSPYVKGCINVSRCGKSCPYIRWCRFRYFRRKCLTEYHDFHIVNHNYMLADVIGQKQGRKPLFPVCGVYVLDEVHHLVDAARQMYGVSLEEKETEQLAGLMTDAKEQVRDKEMLVVTGCLERENRLLFDRLRAGSFMNQDHEGNRAEAVIGQKERAFIRRMHRQLGWLACHQMMGGGQDMVWQMKGKRCRELKEKLDVLLDGQSICWVERRGNGNLALCAIPVKLEQILYRDIWCRPEAVIATSGTMSVRGDFSRFKKMTGLDHMSGKRIMETSKQSPFCYEDQGLLYIPERMPFPDIREERYIRAVMEEIEKLVSATCGHTLILFTSYRLMERVYYGLKTRITYPLFLMGRGRTDMLNRFRKSGNGVLLASDSAGEGGDLAGDILSSLIVVRLPFPVPDPVQEYERRQFEDFDLYRREVILPEMLVKLRQWIGRGIRREDDTAVFSILDRRASLRGKYRAEVLNTLPPMPVTDRIEDVRQFISDKKGDTYFRTDRMKEEL